MARLEDLTIGARVTGIVGDAPVTVVAVSWFGDLGLEVTVKDDRGQLSSQILYREDEARLAVSGAHLPWSFDADADDLRLASEAYRIHIAHLFDPYLAVHTSAIDPLPHQISAVYQEMLPRLPLRYILADDPGAGKTIMTGLFLKELLIRGDLKRCMIVSPGSLAEQPCRAVAGRALSQIQPAFRDPDERSHRVCCDGQRVCGDELLHRTLGQARTE